MAKAKAVQLMATVPEPPELVQTEPGVAEPADAGSDTPRDTPPIYPDDYVIVPVTPPEEPEE